MDILKSEGGEVFAMDAPNWMNDPDKTTLSIGVSKQAIELRAGRGLSWYLGQLYGVVAPGLIMTRHVFQGLRRGMLVGDDDHAEATMLAATWAAKHDARLTGDRFDPALETMEAPPNRVFVVYISINGVLDKYPTIYGWAEHWAWVQADAAPIDAPIDWKTRYDSKLWSAT